MKVHLIRVHEEGACARWQTDPKDLRLVVVIPARPPRLRFGEGVAS